MTLQEIVNRIEVLIRAIVESMMAGYAQASQVFTGKHTDLTDITGTYTHQQIDVLLDTPETDPVFTQWLGSTPLGNYVVGPATATDNLVCLFDGATGKLIKVSNVTVDAKGQMKIIATPDDYGFSLGLEAYGYGVNGYGVVGQSDNIPLQATSLNTASGGVRRVMVYTNDTAHTVPDAGFGLYEDWRFPDKRGNSNLSLSAHVDQVVYTNTTANLEASQKEWYLLFNGTLTKVMWLDGQGNLNITGNINSQNVQNDQLQSDWGQADNLALDYIKNKPVLPDFAGFVKADGTVVYTGNQSLGGFKLTNLSTPTDPNDAARLIDVQNAMVGFNPRDVVVATTANISLTGLQTVDTVILIAQDRVLVKNQATASENGIYLVNAAAWTRATDPISTGMFVLIQSGSQINTAWVLSVDGTIEVGVTDLNFIQFFGLDQTLGGHGMTRTNNQFDVNTASAARIVVNEDNIDLATVVTPGTAGSSALNKVGVITYDAYGRVTGTTEYEIPYPADYGYFKVRVTQEGTPVDLTINTHDTVEFTESTSIKWSVEAGKLKADLVTANSTTNIQYQDITITANVDYTLDTTSLTEPMFIQIFSAAGDLLGFTKYFDGTWKVMVNSTEATQNIDINIIYTHPEADSCKITDITVTADTVYTYDTLSTDKPTSVQITDEGGNEVGFSRFFSTTWMLLIPATGTAQILSVAERYAVDHIVTDHIATVSLEANVDYSYDTLSVLKPQFVQVYDANGDMMTFSRVLNSTWHILIPATETAQSAEICFISNTAGTESVLQQQADWTQPDTEAVSFIKNKPTIPDAQVQSDWNAGSGMGVILNKPVVPAPQVQSDWNATTGLAVILNKPTVPTTPTDGVWDWDPATSKYRPYPTKTTGAFDSGLIAPDALTRLNYNGELYATKFTATANTVYDSGNNWAGVKGINSNATGAGVAGVSNGFGVVAVNDLFGNASTNAAYYGHAYGGAIMGKLYQMHGDPFFDIEYYRNNITTTQPIRVMNMKLADTDAYGHANSAGGYYFNFKNAAGTFVETGALLNRIVDVTTGAETTAWEFWMRHNGAASAKIMELLSSGMLKVPGINLSGLTASRWLALDSNKNIISVDASGFVTGPASATDSTICLFDTTTGKIIKGSSVTIDSRGQLTAIGTPDGSGYSAGLTGYGNGTYGYGVVGLAANIPIQATSLDTAATGSRRVIVYTNDTAHTVPVAGFAIHAEWRFPDLRGLPAGSLASHREEIVYTNVTAMAEASVKKWYLLYGGALTEVMSLDGLGNLSIDGSITATSFIGLTEDISFEFRDVTAGTAQSYDLDIKASYGYTIEAAVLETDNGTLTGVSVKIGATAVTSLSALTVDTAVDETASTGAKTVVAGNRITISTTTGYTGTPTVLRGKIKIKRT